MIASCMDFMREVTPELRFTGGCAPKLGRRMRFAERQNVHGFRERRASYLDTLNCHHTHGPPFHALIRRAPQPSTAKVAISFDQPFQTNNPHNISTTSVPSLARRNEEDDRLIHNLICKGDVYIDMITRSPPTKKIWRQQDLDNGWSVEDEEFDPSENILPALRDLDIPHEEQDVRYLEINQDEQFRGMGNRDYHVADIILSLLANQPPTGGGYSNTYIAAGDRSTIIAQNNHSPKHEAEPGQMIPAFYRWSDVVWLAWTQIARERAGQLHYIIQENITTALTRKVMEIISGGVGPDALDLPWPGRLYDLRSKEGKALLATPHGVGVAFMIADHSDVLGGRKYPAVCIFTARNTVPFLEERWNYYMIWELRDATEGEMDLDQQRTCRDMA
ncbi:MAG: hypothetical protein L6R35_002387 [Caloplaca aegaea]|nr:MAG: hypothetical protein L6R35_002387 [Caloplaca aegaea]